MENDDGRVYKRNISQVQKFDGDIRSNKKDPKHPIDDDVENEIFEEMVPKEPNDVVSSEHQIPERDIVVLGRQIKKPVYLEDYDA
uniref:CSON014951 protein n=1 Tax=Culicoides sonorensis TaxID=179676 RepID=A0A336K6Z4_CULSO